MLVQQKKKRQQVICRATKKGFVQKKELFMPFSFHGDTNDDSRMGIRQYSWGGKRAEIERRIGKSGDKHFADFIVLPEDKMRKNFSSKE